MVADYTTPYNSPSGPINMESSYNTMWVYILAPAAGGIMAGSFEYYNMKVLRRIVKLNEVGSGEVDQ